MSASDKGTTESDNSKYIVMCLGLLIGFVVGFVLLLSSLPVDSGLTEFQAYSSKSAPPKKNNFDFYQLLPEQKTVQPELVPVAVKQPETTQIKEVVAIAAPATHVVPANAQIVSPTTYKEVPANFSAEQQQSYFLQAGKFRNHEQAQAMRAQVLLLGLEAFIVTREEADGVTAHRVRVGPYYDQSILTEAKKRLSRGQINYEIVRVTG